MKTLAAITIACLAMPCVAQAEDKAKKPVVATKPPGHAELAKIQKNQEIERHGEDREPIKPLVNIRKRDLFAISTLFHHNGNWAMVPKGAVIHIPSRLSDKVVTKPRGKLLRWPVFLARYGGLFHTQEVSMLQAKGKEKINPKAIEAYKGTGKIVVATYHRQPITVHLDALKPPAEPGQEKPGQPANSNKHAPK